MSLLNCYVCGIEVNERSSKVVITFQYKEELVVLCGLKCKHTYYMKRNKKVKYNKRK